MIIDTMGCRLRGNMSPGTAVTRKSTQHGVQARAIEGSKYRVGSVTVEFRFSLIHDGVGSCS